MIALGPVRSRRLGMSLGIFEMLVSSRVIKAVNYQGHQFYIRSFTS